MNPESIVALSRIRKEAAERKAADAEIRALIPETPETLALLSKFRAQLKVVDEKITKQEVRLGEANASIEEVSRVGASERLALAEQITTLSAEVSGVAGNLTSASARIEEISAVVASDQIALAAYSRDMTARFDRFDASYNETITLLSTADSALATRTTALEASVDTPTTGLLARVSTIETAYVSADSVLASRATTLEAQMANTAASGLQSRISTEESARASADSTLASRATALESSVDTPTTGLLARMSTVESTKVDASGAYAQATSAISASLSGGSIASAISASVSSEASARATADGYLAGKYALKVVAGNVITGMNITSSTGAGTDVSEINFLTSVFKVTDNVTFKTPFQIVGGKVRFTSDVEVDGALLVAGTLSLSQVSGAGTLASKNAVDLSTSEVTNKSLANVDSAADSKLAGIAAGADVTLSAVNGGLNVTGGGITLSSGGAIKGGASSFSSGTGFFLGYEGGQYKFRVGNPSGARIEWDGSNWTVVSFGGAVPTFTLTLSNSTGNPLYNPVASPSGPYSPGQAVTITADLTPGTFLTWSGSNADKACVADLTQYITTVYMTHDIALTADY